MLFAVFSRRGYDSSDIMAHPARGPTRAGLQPACQLEPIQNSIRLQCYFNGARELVLQGEPYYREGEVSMVSEGAAGPCRSVRFCSSVLRDALFSSRQLKKAISILGV